MSGIAAQVLFWVYADLVHAVHRDTPINCSLTCEAERREGENLQSRAADESRGPSAHDRDALWAPRRPWQLVISPLSSSGTPNDPSKYPSSAAASQPHPR